MAGLHPIESGALLQEGHPQAETNSPSSSEPICAVPAGSAANREPDYVLSHRQLQNVLWLLEKMGKRLHMLQETVHRQAHCPAGGELRSYYLAPQQVKLEKACLREHGVANVGELLDRCAVLLASRPPQRPDRSDPMLDLALDALRDARLIFSQMRRLETLP